MADFEVDSLAIGSRLLANIPASGQFSSSDSVNPLFPDPRVGFGVLKAEILVLKTWILSSRAGSLWSQAALQG